MKENKGGLVLGQVNLARVEERLIHGQVMTTLSNRSGVNSIFVVDDVVAGDQFMKGIYKTAGSRTGHKTIIMTMDKTKQNWDKFEFKEYNAILIAKTVDTFYELVTHGVPMKELNIGGVPQKDPAAKAISGSVYLTEADVEKLVEMKNDFGVEDIYVQATPSDTKITLDDIVAKFK